MNPIISLVILMFLSPVLQWRLFKQRERFSPALLAVAVPVPPTIAISAYLLAQRQYFLSGLVLVVLVAGLIAAYLMARTEERSPVPANEWVSVLSRAALAGGVYVATLAAMALL
jgi:hypothetical protein